MTESRTVPAPSCPEAMTVRWIEILAVVAAVVLCDLTIYRGQGFMGLAALGLGLPLLLLCGSPMRRCNVSLLVMCLLLTGVIARLAWCGSAGAVAVGVACLIGFAMSLAGLPPYVTRALLFASQLIAAGHRGLNLYSSRLATRSSWIPGRGLILSVGFPAVALVVFGTLFVLANPDLVKSVGVQFEQFVNVLTRWFENFSLLEIPFCMAAGWLVIGLLRPDPREPEEWVVMEDADPPGPAPLFEAFRNTLVMVVGLFAVYLVFEFRTLWFREFPKGFHYSGYAHQGAAWLTVALALATVLLSMIFQGRILRDERLGKLRVLSWIWSVENFVLALAVFHRLSIYVGFNGMTRMRTIGWLGITSVVVGFLFVVIKISAEKDFRWLLRRQLWTVSFATYLYFVLPVDCWITQYNVQRILAGDPAPSVQISVHPLSVEGYLELAPLLVCQDAPIRDGIAAMLADRHDLAVRDEVVRLQGGWTARQLAEDRLRNQLNSAQASQNFPAEKRLADGEVFRKYAYQWY